MALINQNDEASARDSLGGLTKVVPGILDLRGVTPPSLANTILVQYGSVIGDAGGGFFIWNPTDTTADNGTTVIRPYSVLQATAGRWNLLAAQNLGAAAAAAIAFGQSARDTAGGAITVASSDRGYLIVNNGGTGIATLPALSSLTPGYTVALMEIGGTTLTVQTTGPDRIYRSNALVGAASVSVLPKETILLMADTVGGQWVLIAGSGKNIQPLAFVPTIVALADGATITPNAAQGNKFTVTIAASRIIAAPTNPSDQQTIEFIITQGGAGTNLITWDAVFHAGATVAFPTLSTAVGARDRITFEYNAATTQWDLLAFSLGY